MVSQELFTSEKEIAIEFFAGTRSFGKVAESKFNVFSVELNPEFQCNMTMSVLDFDEEKFLKEHWIPRAFWASPVCTSYSIAAISHHRYPGWLPKTEEAILWDNLVLKTLKVIRFFEEEAKKQNKKFDWYMENPRGYLRKMPFMQEINHLRKTVTYCQYGDNRMKPTDIWTNSTTWISRPMCKNGDTCHESAPRGSKTGTQWLKGSKLRSVIPKQLMEEIILSIQ